MRYGKVLGDLRAEHDTAMLDVAFLETPDYKTLAAGADRPIVVGRRGTGKSALAYRLRTHFGADSRALVVEVAPSEDQVIGMRPLVELFGPQFKYARAGSRIAWKYAMLMEVARAAAEHYRARKVEFPPTLKERLAEWAPALHAERDVSFRLRCRLRMAVGNADPPAARIGDLASRLGLVEIERDINILLERMGVHAILLADRLDEGFEPDDTGVGLVAGFVQAAIDLNTQFEVARVYLFLRDNIFRTVAREDPDFSRNIEGQVLRLHWDDHQLLNLVAERLRAAFQLTQEQSLKVWNARVADDLQTMDGFRRCLRLTLYRPRDLVALLNDAFLDSGADRISFQNVESTAENISSVRLEDLGKEYGHVFPSLRYLVDTFRDGEAELTFQSVADRRSAALLAARSDIAALKDLEILGGQADVVRALHGIGFLGLREAGGSFVFCHDGKRLDRIQAPTDKVLVHPCYWLALNLSEQPFSRDQAAEIHDDYSIVVASATPEIRAQRLGQLISVVGQIPRGHDGSGAFEDWCAEVIRVVFAGSLANVQLHANKSATQRRDVVATNVADHGLWRRIRDDYGARQVIFEVKNFERLDGDAYRQLHSYLGNSYGRIGFLVTRDEKEEPTRDGDLRWIRELYNVHRVLVVKLNAEFLRKRLAKLRSPQKHNEAETVLARLLDSYERLYVTDAKLPPPE